MHEEKEELCTTNIEQKLVRYADANLNVLLIGSHGVGKSTIVKNLASKLNLKYKYYSSSTLDPWSELIGIPVPDSEKRKETGEKVIDFYRPKDLDEAEFVFFDELNRVTNPRILNTVFEIIQFKSINGTPLKNLRMIWAAINPPEEEYKVEELDPALIDRFQCYVTINAHINVEYLSKFIDVNIVKVLKSWWQEDLGKQQRKVITPRRVEYIGMMIQNNIPWRDSIPRGHEINYRALEGRLRDLYNNVSDFKLSVDSIVENPEHAAEYLINHPELSMRATELLKTVSVKKVFLVRNVIEALPKDMVMSIFNKLPSILIKIQSEFDEVGYSEKDYPKIYEAINTIIKNHEEKIRKKIR